MLTDLQVEQWKQISLDASADALWVDTCRKVDGKRVKVQAEILDFLRAYLSGAVSTEDLRATFDSRTRKEWTGFGLKGMSGAMFLNKLVKHIHDTAELTSKLRPVLCLPTSEEAGRASMRGFFDYLQAAISSGKAAKSQLQPARVSFFISCFWHLQDTKAWPIFYVSGRKVLQLQQIYTPVQETVQDYFAFRKAFLALASALALNAWPLEHLLDWYNKRAATPDNKKPIKQLEDKDEQDDPEDDAASEEEEFSHTQIQWLLATIGKKLGCKIWIASNDQKKEWKGERLGSLSIDKLPSLGLGTESQDIVRLIDVVWLRGTQVAAAFEIEHTTSVYSGLLRMSDLTVLSPNPSFPLYIVAPECRLGKVRRELSRPTFRELELHKRCGFFSDEHLIEQAEGIKKWANDPSVIEKLAMKIDDATDEESNE
jgi:hypothetical protein